MNVVFVTGNANKAKYFSELVGLDIAHQKVDTPEIQSLDLAEVVSKKAKAAYSLIGTPVIVEDTSLTIHAMGRLPGTYIKWFLEELGVEGICKLADLSPGRAATAAATFAYCDQDGVKLFPGGIAGTIAKVPRGSTGFGWNQVFIPDGAVVTLGEMDDASFKSYYKQIKPFQAVKDFLDKQEA